MTKLFLQNSHDTILLSREKLANLTKLFAIESLTALSSERKALRQREFGCEFKDGGRGS